MSTKELQIFGIALFVLGIIAITWTLTRKRWSLFGSVVSVFATFASVFGFLIAATPNPKSVQPLLIVTAAITILVSIVIVGDRTRKTAMMLLYQMMADKQRAKGNIQQAELYDSASDSLRDSLKLPQDGEESL